MNELYRNRAFTDIRRHAGGMPWPAQLRNLSCAAAVTRLQGHNVDNERLLLLRPHHRDKHHRVQRFRAEFAVQPFVNDHEFLLDITAAHGCNQFAALLHKHTSAFII